MVSVLESSLIGSNDVQQQQQGFRGDGHPGEQADSGNQSAPGPAVLRDDRNILQIISAGMQVAKLLKDANAMRDLDTIYAFAEEEVFKRRRR
jgi:hypothetical protein